MLAGAVGMGVAAFLDPALVASPLYDKIWAQLVIQGTAMEVGAIADALTQQRGNNITIRQPAGNRQIILGMQRVGGVMVYATTKGNSYDHYHRIIVLAGHVCHSILNMYIDGRKVYWKGSGTGWSVRNGVGFGGWCDDQDHIGPDGTTYNFNGNLVYAEARYGDQLPGDVMASMTANDPNWAASAAGSPYVGGCTYVYLQVSYDAAMFPNGVQSEIRFDVNGKSDIYDPRTGTTGFTTNWALLVADRMTDTAYGLGIPYSEINEEQLIAAANVCDEQVLLANGGYEARYSCNWHGDTSTGPGDVISLMMSAAAGRLSRIGGQWYIWPAYWQGPSFSFNERVLLGDDFTFSPYRSLKDRFNRVTGTYIAANYPYNAAGNLYDSNGWYDGTIENTFQFGFQPTNFPQYAMDTNHGYATDKWLNADGGHALPMEVQMQCTLSVSQAQRVAKIMLMRNRMEGTGSMSCSLATWGMQPTDVMYFSFAKRGWNNKIFEITGTTLHIEERSSDSGGRGVACWLSFNFNETSQDVYEWSTTEEQTVYAVPSGLSQTPGVVTPPTGLTLASVTSTGQNSGLGGDSTNYAISVTWTTPLDVAVTQIEIQAKTHSSTTWFDAGTVSVSSAAARVYGVNQGTSYDVRIRSLRSNGAASDWVERDSYTV